MIDVQRLAAIVQVLDAHLDGDGVADAYHVQPLAQDWARVSKGGEEVGEAIDALIGLTGQNPRKGEYGTLEELLDELADVCLTGLYGIQHFTKDIQRTMEKVLARAEHHAERVGLTP